MIKEDLIQQKEKKRRHFAKKIKNNEKRRININVCVRNDNVQI